jgi:hypothetical protein
MYMIIQYRIIVKIIVNCGTSTSRGRGGCRGRGGKTTINSAYYFTDEYLKAIKKRANRRLF